MEDLGRIRRRNGAHRWTLHQDVDDPGRWVERFHSLTWIDHLRRQTRHTRADQTVLDRVAALRDEPVVVNRMLERGISTALIRSEERSGGNECGVTCRSWWNA